MSHGFLALRVYPTAEAVGWAGSSHWFQGCARCVSQRCGAMPRGCVEWFG